MIYRRDLFNPLKYSTCFTDGRIKLDRFVCLKKRLAHMGSKPCATLPKGYVQFLFTLICSFYLGIETKNAPSYAIRPHRVRSNVDIPPWSLTFGIRTTVDIFFNEC